MRIFFKRFIGLTFILLALPGIILGPVGVYGVWQVHTAVLTEFYETTQLFYEALSSISDGLVIIDQALQTGSESMDSVVQVTASMAATMEDIGVMAEVFQRFLQSGVASLILPNAERLDSSGKNLKTMQADLGNMLAQMNEINVTLTQAQVVVRDYQNIIGEMQTKVLEIQTVGPTWITILAWVTTIGLVWVTLAQIGLVLQGWDYLRTPEGKGQRE